MRNKSRDAYLIITTVFFTLMITVVLYNMFLNTGEIKKFNEVREILKNEYYVALDQNKLVDDALNGMVDAIGDKYTDYLTKAEWDERKKDFAGEYTGIGVSFDTNAKGDVFIAEIYEASPAQKAGLKVGDILKVFEGIKLTKESDVEQMFADFTGDSITMKLYRPSTKALFVKTVQKETIVEINATSKVIDNEIGYIKLESFDDDIAKDFKALYSKLAAKEIKGLIIDVRDNFGGSLNQVVEICDFLLPKCTIVSVQGQRTEKEYYYSDETGISIPITVLVNKNSASASEVLAGALKDNKRATLVGNKTFGKGLVQNSTEFDDGSAIYYTEARYFTPSGICIHGIGIEPDIKVSLAKKYDKYYVSSIPTADDLQLKAAIKDVKGKIK